MPLRPPPLVRRLAAALRRVIDEPRLRQEVLWVMTSRTLEFTLVFVLLKVLTNTLGKHGFGEYNLADTALVLVSSIVLLPVHEPFMRDYHGARRRGEGRAAGIFLLTWYLAGTGGIALGAALLTGLFSRRFGLEPWTALAAGLVFFFDRWRFLGQEALNIRRERRVWALQNVGYFVVQVSLITLVVTHLRATPSAALLAYATAAAAFAAIGALPLVREVLATPPGRATVMPQLVRSYGVPLAILLVFQWIQGFTDRYLLNALVDTETVGLYVACYQVSGIPYQFLLRLTHSLLTPIAFQRSHDIEDPKLLWAADRVLLAGIALQVVVGAGMLVLYGLFGRRLMVLLTSPQYALPTSTILIITAGRFIQAMSQALQPVFGVHHRMQSMLGFRVLGAALTSGICWWAIRGHGLLGAAVGTLVATSLYTAGLVLLPNGCFWLVNDARRRAAARGPDGSVAR